MANEIQTSAELAQAGFTSTIATNNGGLFNNGHIAVSKDMIFGLCVWNGDGWYPLSDATTTELRIVQALIAKGGHFLWQDKMDELIAKSGDFLWQDKMDELIAKSGV